MDDLDYLQKKMDGLVQRYEQQRDALFDQIDRVSARVAASGLDLHTVMPLDFSDAEALQKWRGAAATELARLLPVQEVEAILLPLDLLQPAGAPSGSAAVRPMSVGVSRRIASFNL